MTNKLNNSIVNSMKVIFENLEKKENQARKRANKKLSVKSRLKKRMSALTKARKQKESAKKTDASSKRSSSKRSSSKSSSSNNVCLMLSQLKKIVKQNPEKEMLVKVRPATKGGLRFCAESREEFKIYSTKRSSKKSTKNNSTKKSTAPSKTKYTRKDFLFKPIGLKK